MAEKLSLENVRSRLEGLVRDSKVPGLQFLVLDQDQTIFEYCGGWADIANRRPMNASTTLMAYSMSKTITAVAVLQLAAAGKLQLDDAIDRYFDSHPYGPGITVRHLLTHTSGIPNPIPLSWIHSPAAHDKFQERLELDSVMRRHPKLAFPPGKKFGYSNIGYWLLGPIVERVSGELFTQYVRRSILAPLGIAPQELDYTISSDEAHARGYLEKYSFLNLIKRFVVAPKWIDRYEGRWLHIRDHYLNGPAFGGLVGTARGFGKFLQEQLREQSSILNGPMRELLFEPQYIDAGKPIPMTLGWHIDARFAPSFFYKEGGGGGFHCMMRVYRKSGFAAIVMTNATQFDVRGLLDSTIR